jgi:hypothetical protein
VSPHCVCLAQKDDLFPSQGSMTLGGSLSKEIEIRLLLVEPGCIAH